MLLGIDFETTGLDPATCLPIEAAAVVVDENWRTVASLSSLLYTPAWGDEPSPPEVVAIHGIKNETLRRLGASPEWFFRQVSSMLVSFGVTEVVAHNGTGFDKIIAERFCPPLAALPWIDTRTDVPYPDPTGSKRLGYLAADHGFLNPFPHAALADVLTMFRVLSQYPLEEVRRRAASPTLTVRANVSYDDRELAKKQRYMWEKVDNVHVPRAWLKRLKECDLEAERARCPFEVVVV